MQGQKVFKDNWIMLVAFLVGRINICGINPFIVALIVAACIHNKNVIGVYISGMVGLAFVAPSTMLIKYAVMLLGLIAIFNIKSLLQINCSRVLICAITFLFVVLINYSIEYFIPGAVEAYVGVLEGIIASMLSVVFYKGIRCLALDYAKMCVDGAMAIGVIMLLAVSLMGLPTELCDVVIELTVALFSVMFMLYKFGMGVGLTWGIVASIVTAYSYNNFGILSGWLIIMITAFSLEQICSFRRLGFMISYLAAYYGVGIAIYPELINENGQKAIISACVLFALMPQVVMTKIDGRIKNDELYSTSPEWGRLVVERITNLANACKRIEYNMAGNSTVGIRLNEIGEMIESFTNQLDSVVPLRKTIEANILEELARKGIVVKSILATRNTDQRFEVFINARSERRRLISAYEIEKTASKYMNIPMEIKDESKRVIGGRFGMICLKESSRYNCKSAVRRLIKYDEEVSGDNYFIGDILEGNKLIIISDGMGSGHKAQSDSSNLIDTLEELLDAGFDKDMAIKIINSYLAEQNKGEHFSTLDMLLFDTYTGCGRIYKQGAATTFVKRGQWIEMIKSTSLPVGVVHNAACEKCVKKFYEGDIIIMLSDGVLDSIIVENKDDYINDFIQQSKYFEPEEIADDLVDNIMAMSGRRLKDDATIIVSKIYKRC